MNGTFCSPSPPCERRRWPASPDRSCSARAEPITVLASPSTTKSPSRSSGSSKRRAAAGPSSTASTPGSARLAAISAAEIRRLAHVDAHERAERPVVAHERIGDRADDAHRAVAEARVQLLLQEDHVGRAVGLRLVVHAVIGDDADHGSGRHQARDPVIDGAVEGVGLGRARSMRVLDEIGQRQIEQRRRLALAAGARPASST